MFRRAVRLMVDSAEKSMAHAGVTIDDIKLIVPHQANIRIIQAACDRFGIPIERASVVIEHTGNTSSAIDPARARRCARPRQGRARRPVAARRLRRRHDGSQLRPAMGRGCPMTDSTGEPRVVLVTGGSRGIGLACAERFKSLGDHVAVTYHSSPPPEGFFGVKCDVTDTEQVDAGIRVRRGAVRGAGRDPRLERRRHSRRAAAPYERGRLRQRHRREPHGVVSRRQACRTRHAQGAQGPDRADVVGGRPARRRRSGRTTPPRSRGWSASRGHSPASSGHAASR